MPTKGTIDTTSYTDSSPTTDTPRTDISNKNSNNNTAATATINAIVMSLPFSDHCHEDTLDTFPESIPIIAANGSYRRLKSYYGKLRNIIELPSSDFHYPSAAVRITGSSFDIVTVQSKLGSLDLTLWVNICHSFFCFY